MTNALGILGGTFDPVHNAHLTLAKEAYEQFNLDKVLFVVTGKPARKLTSTLASPEQRYEMLTAACEPYPYFEVSRLEIDRPEVSYTIDTLKILAEQYGSDCQLYFIAGRDSVLDMPTWKDAHQIAQMVTVLSANREVPDTMQFTNASPLTDLIDKSGCQQKPDFTIVDFQIPPTTLSSSDVRNRIKAGLSVENMVPKPAWDYIRWHALYD